MATGDTGVITSTADTILSECRMSLIIEIAVDSLADALAAERAGADRLELCSSLDAHGLTASPRVLADFRMDSMLPVAAMVRPRAGGFVASPSDQFLAPRQAEALLAAGADAVVFGFLNPDNTIDTELCERMVGVAGAAKAVFHRAFDLSPDPFAAIEVLIELGVHRILTAGFSATATAYELGMPTAPYVPEALDTRLLTIRKYQEKARGRIEILPCGGIRAENARLFVGETGAGQIHSACRSKGGKKLDVKMARELVSTLRPPLASEA